MVKDPQPHDATTHHIRHDHARGPVTAEPYDGPQSARGTHTPHTARVAHCVHGSSVSKCVVTGADRRPTLDSAHVQGYPYTVIHGSPHSACYRGGGGSWNGGWTQTDRASALNGTCRWTFSAHADAAPLVSLQVPRAHSSAAPPVGNGTAGPRTERSATFKQSPRAWAGH
jgi:hypothetical protein